MAKVKIQGHASGTGTLTVTAPNTSTDRTITLPDGDVTLGAATPSITDNGNATAITIDSSENVGIGVVPEDSYTGRPTLRIGSGLTIGSYGSNNPSHHWINANAYQAASDATEKYIGTDQASQLKQTNGTFDFKVAASGSADAAITWTTGFEVLNDGKVRAKNGLLFGTDTAEVNALDDYEEGTWTPVFSGSDTAGTYTYSQQHGNYIKIGKMVTIWFSLFNISASSSGGGNIRILGVPFTVNSDPHRGMVGTLELDDFTFSGSLSTTVESGMTYITPRQSISGNNDSILQVSNRSNNTSDLCGCITYMEA